MVVGEHQEAGTIGEGHPQSLTDIFIKHPVLAVHRESRDPARGVAGIDDPALAAISKDRKLVRDYHDGLLRRQRRNRPWFSQYTDRNGVVSAIGGRLCGVDHREPCQHRHGALEARPQQHGGTGRRSRRGSNGTIRAAGGSRRSRLRSKCNEPIAPYTSFCHLPLRNARCRPSRIGCCARCGPTLDIARCPAVTFKEKQCRHANLDRP